MRRFASLAATYLAAVVVAASSSARADGLFYKLPEDGTSARFDLDLSGGPTGTEMKSTGTLTMSSVGRVTENDEKCRWIEFKLVLKNQQDQERTIISKVLIPEKHLAKGKSPADHLVRGWLKREMGEVQELNDLKNPNAGPLPAFLSGPLKDAKDLEAIEIDSILGKLACAGQTGRNESEQGAIMAVAEFENRLHEKAPFGVVASKIRF